MSINRTRSRKTTIKKREFSYYFGFAEYIIEELYDREIISDSQKGSGDCWHSKVVRPLIGELTRPVQHDMFHSHLISWYHPHPQDHVDALIREYVNKTVFGDINSDSDFELLPFLAELDDTIAMFSWKFIKDLSYGSFTWGIMPFISELKGLFKSIDAILNSAPPKVQKTLNRKRRVALEEPFVLPPPGVISSYVYKTFGVFRVRGSRKFIFPAHSERIQKALWLLDTLGAHPDLKTAWDLLPASFVVDYFLPVGDLLESLHPRGWLAAGTSFEGTASFKGDIHTALSGKPPGRGSRWSLVQFYNEMYCTHRVYRRVHSVWGQAPTSITWKSPSARQLFNTAYLTSFLKRVF